METRNRLIAVGEEEEGGNGGRNGRGYSKNVYEWLVDMDNGEGIDWGREG